MTCYVSSGTLNSTNSTQQSAQPHFIALSAVDLEWHLACQNSAPEVPEGFYPNVE